MRRSRCSAGRESASEPVQRAARAAVLLALIFSSAYSHAIAPPLQSGSRAAVRERAVASPDVHRRQVRAEGWLEAAGEDPSVMPASLATAGALKVLFIRVNFPDDPTDPQSAASCQAMMDGDVSDFFRSNSYGSIPGVLTTLTPLITMPLPRADYDGQPGQLTDDAMQEASDPPYGYDVHQFDRFVIRYVTLSVSGSAVRTTDGVRGILLRGPAGSSSPGIVNHEFGHTFGLSHANAWQADGGTIVGLGSSVEYGDPFDTMGRGWMADSYSKAHFNAAEKYSLGWLPASNVRTVTADGTYRLYSFDDVDTLAPDSAYVLKIAKGDGREYWLDHRRLWTENVSESNGVEVLWGPDRTRRLDTTPENSTWLLQDWQDSALRLGWTMADEVSAIYITPVAMDSEPDPPHWIDVEVARGQFPGNRPPTCALGASATAVAVGSPVTFTASASDSDGDSLAYGWAFDGAFGGDRTPVNGPVIIRTFPSAGEYVVRCVVSDKRGGRAADSVLVRVGSTAGYRIAGTVTAAGAPLEGVRVTAGSSIGYTDSAGNYTISNLAAGSYPMSASRGFYACSPSNVTVVVAPNARADFTCLPSTYTLSGQVWYRATSPIPVTATNGSTVLTADTGTDGNYAFTGVPVGSYRLTVDPALHLGTNFANPVVVEGADRPNLLFVGAALGIDTNNLARAVQWIPYSQTIFASGGNPARYAWSTTGSLPPGLSLAPDGTPSTTLSGTPTAAGAYAFTVTVTDAYGTSTSVPYSVEVAPPAPLSIATASLPDGTPNHAYSALVTAGGGFQADYTWTTTGVLPPGLSLSPDGTPSATISGMPTSEGTYSFVVAVRDPMGASASRELRIVVAALTLVTLTLPNATRGDTYAAPILALGGSGSNYTWRYTGRLPEGITLSGIGNTAAILWGTPRSTGFFPFTVSVTDSAGNTATRSLQLIVNAPHVEQAP